MAFLSGADVVRIYCLPSPCARLSRAPTTTKAPPPARDVAGLGSLPAFAGPALVSGFSCSKEKTRGAVGGRLCPWSGRSPSDWELGRRHAHVGRTQSAVENQPGSGNMPVHVDGL